MNARDRHGDDLRRDAELGVPRELAIREAREVLMSADERYTQALDHAAQVQDPKRIDAAFHDVDRLQREMISAIRRVRELEREAGEAPPAEASSSVPTLPPRQERSARHTDRPNWARPIDPSRPHRRTRRPS